MRHRIHTVFDEYIPTSAGTVYTSNEWNATIGQHDQITIMTVVDNVSTVSGTFNLWIEHSADGRLWIQRNDSNQGNPPPNSGNSGDISLTGMSSVQAILGMYSDCAIGISKGGSSTTVNGPLLPFVRFAMKLSVVGAHVRVTYTGRGHAM